MIGNHKHSHTVANWGDSRVQSTRLPIITTPVPNILNPLSPENDQNQFSANDIHRLSRD